MSAHYMFLPLHNLDLLVVLSPAFSLQFCKDVEPGNSRAKDCLEENRSKLSTGCRFVAIFQITPHGMAVVWLLLFDLHSPHAAWFLAMVLCMPCHW
jgi:hypothetical protein